MNKYYVYLIFICIFISSRVEAKEFRLDEIKLFSDYCYSLIKVENIDELALKFHNPPAYSATLVVNEIDGIKLSLMELIQIFGKIGPGEFIRDNLSFYNISAGGGDIKYWQEHPDFIQVGYKTTFMKQGEGYVLFQVVAILDKLELKAISYGIPISSPNAKERIENINNIWMSYINRRANSG